MYKYQSLDFLLLFSYRISHLICQFSYYRKRDLLSLGTSGDHTLSDHRSQILKRMFSSRLPPDVELVRLQPAHMKAVYDLYPASDIECREVFEKLVAELPAYGIFVEGELAAWMVQSYYGAMFSMQTRPEFRRKGYGIYLARRLTKEVAARGYKPFVVIRPENDASRSLYTKLGFERRFRTVRAVLRPR